MNKSTNPIIDALHKTPKPKQSASFKQEMHMAIDSRIIDSKHKQSRGLAWYIKKWHFAIPVAALFLIVGTVSLLTQHNSTPTTEQVVIHDASNDPEIQEIIALAFSFEAISDNPKTTDTPNTVKTSSSDTTDMILAYLRE